MAPAGAVALRKRPVNMALPAQARRCRRLRELVGPAGFEPATKGFTSSRRFRRAWTISSPATSREGAGRSSLSSRALGSAIQPSGSLCTLRRCIAVLAQDCHRSCDRKVPLNSSRPLRGFHREGTIVDESPALTVVLQAHVGADSSSGAGGLPKQIVRGSGGPPQRSVSTSLYRPRCFVLPAAPVQDQPASVLRTGDLSPTGAMTHHRWAPSPFRGSDAIRFS